MQQMVTEYQPLQEPNLLFPAYPKVSNFSFFKVLGLLFVKIKVLESLTELTGRQGKKKKKEAFLV